MCNTGKAHIVFWKARVRFFFGCDASTAEKPCSGPKTWQSIDVPDELRILPGSISNTNTGGSDLAGGKKRPAEEAEPNESASPDEELLKENDKHAKINPA